MEDSVSILREVLEKYHPHVALASSFSLEDIVLIDMLMKIRKDARVFALDTGRLNPETYECAEDVRRRYGLAIEWHFPRRESVEKLLAEEGLFSFKQSLDARKRCCQVRKVDQMPGALHGLRAWITGMRNEQSTTRKGLKVIEDDPVNEGLIKVNPLATWTLCDLWDYVKQFRLPYNRLYDQGFQSIGCAPCTRAVSAGEDQRAGRWWWEQSEHKECGLHPRKAFLAS
jgi:phosphoadenosine phosphosulfate reductase